VAQTITQQFTDQLDGLEGRNDMGKRRDIIVRDRLPFDAEPPGSALDGRGIGRVDVSLDEGRSWRQADLHPVISQWAWRLWSLTVEAHPGRSLSPPGRGMTQASHNRNPRRRYGIRGGSGNNAWAHVKAFAR
jgi:sulfite oxidase